MKDSSRDLTQKKHLASQTLCSAAGSWCFLNSAINAKVSSCPPLYGDASWHIYSICTALTTPCGCNHLIGVFHLVKWSSAEWLSTRTKVKLCGGFIFLDSVRACRLIFEFFKDLTLICLYSKKTIKPCMHALFFICVAALLSVLFYHITSDTPFLRQCNYIKKRASSRYNQKLLTLKKKEQ